MRLAAGHGGFRTVWGTLLTAAALLALPRDMFAQIYPWAAGFFHRDPSISTAPLGDGYLDRNIDILVVHARCDALRLSRHGGMDCMRTDPGAVDRIVAVGRG